MTKNILVAPVVAAALVGPGFAQEGSKARPLELRDPSGWLQGFSPPSNLLGKAETIEFTLVVDAEGKVAECRVDRSSGFVQFDSQVCAFLRSRATFWPALDDAGRPVPASWSSSFRMWKD